MSTASEARDITSRALAGEVGIFVLIVPPPRHVQAARADIQVWIDSQGHSGIGVFVPGLAWDGTVLTDTRTTFAVVAPIFMRNLCDLQVSTVIHLTASHVPLGGQRARRCD